jgi:hypothetical protein
VRLWSGVFGREGGSWMRFVAGVDASSAIENGGFGVWKRRDGETR